MSVHAGGAMTSPITRDELRAAIDSGTVTVVDALPVALYSRRHIPGALNLVEDEVDVETPWLLPDKGATIVAYSTNAACGRGEALGERLECLGYTDVRVYRDGIEDWVAAELPVNTGPPRTHR
jgi:rhodanese-related sulfurtransferase